MAIFGKGLGNMRQFGKGLARAGSILQKGSQAAGKVYGALDRVGVADVIPGGNYVKGAIDLAGSIGSAAQDVGEALQ
jgi:hypothetical protein